MTPTSPTPPPTSLKLTARSPEDLLALAPIVLGFVPTNSVVMLTFGARHPFHARVDLPPGSGPGAVAEVADLLLEPAARHRVERIVLLVYSDDADLARAVWAALAERALLCCIEVLEVLRVGADRWWPLHGPEGTDPSWGHPGVAFDVTAHPFVVQAIVDGRVTLGSRDALAAGVAADPDAVRRVAAAVDELPDEADDLPLEGAWAQALVRTHVAAGTVPDDADVARLLRGMQHVVVRDAAWSCLRRDRAREHVGFWTHVTRRTPSWLLPPAATLLGWSAWQAGDGALAWCALDRCGEVDPDYPPMLLLADALDNAVPPAAWDGLGLSGFGPDGGSLLAG